MKKIVFSLILLIFPLTVSALEFNINSNNVVLYNLNEDSIIYQKNSDEKISIASMTKIMTAIIAIENIDNLDNEIVLTNKDFEGLIEANAATAGFNVGSKVTYRDLLYGLLFKSGAECAQALANNTAGSIDEFVKLMNQKAKQLKLNTTNFANPTGFDDENHYSSVKDVATMFKYALKNKKFKEIIISKIYTTRYTNLTFISTTKNNNDRYNLEMDYLIGGKTGYTTDAGVCLASIATYNDVNYMLVTAKAPYVKNKPTAFLDAKEIYEYFMNNYSYKKIVSKNDTLVTLKTLYLKKDKISFKSEKDIKLYLNNNFDKKDVKYKYSGKKTITYKTKLEEKIGKVDIYYKNKLITTVDIILKEEPKLDIIKYIIGHKKVVIIIVIIIILIKKLLKQKNRIYYN